MKQRSLAAPAAIGAALGGVLWVLDSELRSFVFPATDFWKELTHPEPDVFTVRLLAMFLMVVAAVMAGALVQLYEQRHHAATLGERVRALYGHTPDPIIGLDRDLRIVFTNDASAALVNSTTSELEGCVCYEVIKGLAEPCEGCRAASVFTTGSMALRETYETLVDGSERWVEQVWRPFRNDEDDSVELVIEVVRDITRLKCFENEVAERQRAEAELLAERDLKQRYLDATTSLMVAIAPDGRLTMLNRRACDVLERPCSELVGRPWYEVFLSEELQATQCDAMRLEAVAGTSFESELIAPSGRRRIIAWGVSPLAPDDKDGSASGVLCSGVDVTEQREAELALEFRSVLLDSATDEIIVHRPDGTFVYANEEFYRRRGLTREQTASMAPWGWVPPETPNRTADIMRRVFDSEVVVFEGRARCADGTLMPVEIHASLTEIDGQTLVVSSARDVSERKQAEETIQRMAFYDELTGLANRALFLDRLRIALANSTRSGHPVAVMFLDVDHFKNINDTLGHTVGDRLLQSVASRLAVNVREGDTLARLGGDEFTLVIPEISEIDDAEVVASKILAAFEEPFDIGGGKELRITASLGLTLGTGDTLNVEEALAQADAAMYRAKEDGRNRCRTYCDQLGVEASERFGLREQLREALDRNQFTLLYQPQVDASSGKVRGVEALIRWNHPDRGVLSPSQFLHVAEEAGLMPGLGAWTLCEVDRDVRAWTQAGLDDVRVAVNVSPKELSDSRLVPLLAGLIAQPGVDPSRLELEITETCALSDPEAVREVLLRIRAMGVRIIIDDFGTGFSSLDHLRRLPVDAIKVDRTFVQEIGINPEAAVIARTVIALAHALELEVIAEGVETIRQRDYLRDCGCDVMQGFLFAEPVCAERVVALLSDGVNVVS